MAHIVYRKSDHATRLALAARNIQAQGQKNEADSPILIIGVSTKKSTKNRSEASITSLQRISVNCYNTAVNIKI